MNPYEKYLIGNITQEEIENLLLKESIKDTSHSAIREYSPNTDFINSLLADFDSPIVSENEDSECEKTVNIKEIAENILDNSTTPNTIDSELEEYLDSLHFASLMKNLNTQNNLLTSLLPEKFDGIITVLLDYSNCYDLYSYTEIKEGMNQKNPLLYTTCINFFDFSTIKNGYDVRIQKEIGSSILLSDLIKNPMKYTNESITESTNLLSLVLNNQVNFLK